MIQDYAEKRRAGSSSSTAAARGNPVHLTLILFALVASLLVVDGSSTTRGGLSVEETPTTRYLHSRRHSSRRYATRPAASDKCRRRHTPTEALEAAEKRCAAQGKKVCPVCLKCVEPGAWHPYGRGRCKLDPGLKAPPVFKSST